MYNQKIVIPGGAGLVGQNLITRLEARGYSNILVIDKHSANLKTLQSLHPNVKTILADLSKPNGWNKNFENADTVIMLQAHIGGLYYDEFKKNNVNSTQIILNLIKQYNIPNLIHISSSVVESVANDFYTNIKKEQEKLVLESGISCPILRPTLMFGWFDRKHLGWLSRFIQKGLIGCKNWMNLKYLSISIMLGLFAWGIVALSFVYLVHNLSSAPFSLNYFAIYPLSMLAGAASMMPGGVGTTETAIILLLTNLKMNLNTSLVIAMSIRFATLWFAIVCGFVSILILELLNYKSQNSIPNIDASKNT